MTQRVNKKKTLDFKGVSQASLIDKSTTNLAEKY